MTELRALRALFDRVPGVGLVLMDAGGGITGFGPGAEAFFRTPAGSVLGRHYSSLYDPEEMKACAGSPAFQEELERTGMHEAVWTIRPAGAPPFRARVTLVPLTGLDNPPAGTDNPRTGWAALHRALP